METKRCLFCEQIVPARLVGEELLFENCFCAPSGQYRLRHDYYATGQEAGFRAKSELFPLVSGYIRERTEYDEAVALTEETIASIRTSPDVPGSIEEKAIRLIRYLYRNAQGANVPVFIHRLTERYNLTYSPNLQEFIYIIDCLRQEGLIERSGSSLKLTEEGWAKAAEAEGKLGAKRCAVLLPRDEQLRQAWIDDILPGLASIGYQPMLNTWEEQRRGDEDAATMLAGCKFAIADATGQSPSVFYAAGFAQGNRIPVIWTVRKEQADGVSVPPGQARPIRWADTEELAAKLQLQFRKEE
ncbi:hypothetical protein [Paenibacillus methanolicus]|uniref:Uncharacterized protein n=1 Tax=Paenibacillus methanolicus TaxID=582686 RepID=A0A5S5CDF1_9BACL|nr:hypothetical protein [Paenibacillus methanolicus]TYP76356.1 hypothetical protein BCM02_10317 [Paenibacillus methanolicus]